MIVQNKSYLSSLLATRNDHITKIKTNDYIWKYVHLQELSLKKKDILFSILPVNWNVNVIELRRRVSHPGVELGNGSHIQLSKRSPTITSLDQLSIFVNERNNLYLVKPLLHTSLL